jgi:hypothetical protein
LPAGEPEKEAFLLELCQCFHPYLMKYLVMICRGHVPVVGRGDKGAPINKDIKPFLLYFLPKGQRLDWHTMNQIVKHFHLAFKGIETEEIYDILMAQLVATIKGYDPTYTDKVKLLVEAINHGLSQRKQFSFVDVNRHLDFDCNRYIRLLGRMGFLQSVPQRPAWSKKKFIALRGFPERLKIVSCGPRQLEQLRQQIFRLAKIHAQAARQLDPEAVRIVIFLVAVRGAANQTKSVDFPSSYVSM